VTIVLIVLVIVLAVALAALAWVQVRDRRWQPAPPQTSESRRIVFPFLAHALSPAALDAALRLARAQDATLVPVFLARVSLDLPLDAPLPRQCAFAIPLQEAIEQRAAKFGVRVDARIERGRSYRHALRQVIANERFDWIVIAAATMDGPGFDAEDVRWLLDNAPGEIVVVRPTKDEQIGLPSVRPRRQVRSAGNRRARRRRERLSPT
jgi:nucleotide-binding universal stress UspA family protein